MILMCTKVEARDADSGTFGEILYEISSGNSQSVFTIDPPRTGIIKTTVPLDREIQDVYRLEVRAYNADRRHKYSTAVVRISVVDANDNAPFFPTYSPLFVHEGTLSYFCVYTVSGKKATLFSTTTLAFFGRFL